MGLIIANPWGALGLASAVALVAIYFLQEQTKLRTISTLFLLERTNPSTAQGHAFQRFQSSWPFLLQLFALLLLAWVMLEPRFQQSTGVQRTVVVIDSSLSMVPFMDEARESLRRELAEVSRVTGQNEWIVLESDSSRNSLYRGTELAEAMKVLSRWTPRRGHHDMSKALRVAQSLGGQHGLQILVTDHAYQVPDGVTVLSVGKPIDNVGFTGARLVEKEGGSREWEALIRNYSDHPISRAWWVEGEKGKSEQQPLTIGPGGLGVVRGGFPNGQHSVTVKLVGDSFPIDDVMPIVSDQVKKIGVFVEAAMRARSKFQETIELFDGISYTADRSRAVISIEDFRPGTVDFPARTGIIVLSDTAGQVPEGPIVTEHHPLVAGLEWQGLQVRVKGSLPVEKSDQVLVWQGKHPLFLLRERGDVSQLLINFEPNSTNLFQLPAFVVLLYRFVEHVRAHQTGYERHNLISGQLVDMYVSRSIKSLKFVVDNSSTGSSEDVSEISPSQVRYLRAPIFPSRFSVQERDRVLFEGTSQFSDTREADFSKASRVNTVAGKVPGLMLVRSEADLLWPLWVLLSAACFVSAWYLQGRRV